MEAAAIDVAPVIKLKELAPGFAKQWTGANRSSHACIKCVKGLFGGRWFSMQTGEMEVVGSDVADDVSLSIETAAANVAGRHARLIGGSGVVACSIQDISPPTQGVYVATRHIHRHQVSPGNALVFEMLTPRDLGSSAAFNYPETSTEAASSNEKDDAGSFRPTHYSAHTQYPPEGQTLLVERGSPAASDVEAFKTFLAVYELVPEVKDWVLLHCQDLQKASPSKDIFEAFVQFKTTYVFLEALRRLPLECQILLTLAASEVETFMPWQSKSETLKLKSQNTGEVLAEVGWTGAYLVPFNHVEKNVDRVAAVSDPTNAPQFLPPPEPPAAEPAFISTPSPSPAVSTLPFARPATARPALIPSASLSRRPESSRATLLSSFSRCPESPTTNSAWAFYQTNPLVTQSPSRIVLSPIGDASPTPGAVPTTPVSPVTGSPRHEVVSGLQVYGSVYPRSQEPVAVASASRLSGSAFRLCHDFYSSGDVHTEPSLRRPVSPSPGDVERRPAARSALPSTQELFYRGFEQPKWMPVAHRMSLATPLSPTRASVASVTGGAMSPPSTRETAGSPSRVSHPGRDVQLPAAPHPKFSTVVDHEAAPLEHSASSPAVFSISSGPPSPCRLPPSPLPPNDLLRSDSNSAAAAAFDEVGADKDAGWDAARMELSNASPSKMFSPLKLLSTFFSASPKPSTEATPESKLPASCPVTLSSSPTEILPKSMPRNSLSLDSFSKLPGVELDTAAVTGDGDAAQLEPILHSTAGIIWPELSEIAAKLADSAGEDTKSESTWSQSAVSAMGEVAFWVNVFLESAQLRIFANDHPNIPLPLPIPDLLQPNIYNSSSLFRNRGLGLPLHLTLLPRKLTFHIDKETDGLRAHIGSDSSVTMESLPVRLRRAKAWLLRTPDQVLLTSGNPSHRPVVKLPPSFGTGYHLSVKFINGEYLLFDSYPAESIDYSFAAPAIRSVSVCNPPVAEKNPFSQTQTELESNGGSNSRLRKRVPQLDVVDAVWIKLIPHRETRPLKFGDVFRIGNLEFQCLRFNTGFGSLQGYRPTMEDEEVAFQDLGVSDHIPVSFYAVYDGHGGRECAAFLHEELHLSFVHQLEVLTGHLDVAPEAAKAIFEALYRAFVVSDRAFLKLQLQRVRTTGTRNGPGGTAVVVVVAGNKLFCSNCGDARAVLSRGGTAIQLSIDHKPDRLDETRRIHKAKGHVKNRRVLGRLAVSRAFGDIEYKCVAGSAPALVIVDPEIRSIDLCNDDEFILLACDGLFDVYSSQEVVSLVRDQLEAHNNDAQKVVETIVQDAIIAKQSRDNVSAILILLKHD